MHGTAGLLQGSGGVARLPGGNQTESIVAFRA